MKKILIVEDSVLVRNLIKTKLESIGYQVHTASDGLEAIRKIREHDLNLIVLDLMLPKVSGIEVLRGICSKEYRDTVIPTIIISSNDSDSFKNRSLKLGARCFIKKPFDLDEVVLEVEQHLLGEE